MPDITLVTYLIVCPLVFLAGFVDAIAGGGGLISLPAYMIAGFPPHFAIGTNKLSAAMGTIVSTYRFGKRGNIPWKIALPCVVLSIIGSAAGARIALMVGTELFRKIMLVIIPVTAYYVMKTKNLDIEQKTMSQRQTLISACIASLVIGVYDGFYGPGTGTFLILLLTSIAGFSLGDANGTAKAINLATNITSLAVYMLHGKAIFTLGLTAGIFGIIGNYLGVSFFNEKGSKAVKPIMIGVLILFFIKVLSEII